jgi:signal transduction histidine kinase
MLRTGQAGQFDENEVFEQYDINEFLDKASLTSRRLKVAFKVALRAFRMHNDITTLMQHETFLREAADTANVAKSGFLANMSHELRSPLTSIESGLSTIEEVLTDPHADIEDLSDMLTAVFYARISSNRLMKLLNGILDLSKLETGKMDINVKQEDLRRIAQMACAEVYPLLKVKSLSLEITKDDTDTTICLDSERIIQVLINLLSNAIKFSSHGQTIRLSFSQITLQTDQEMADSGGEQALCLTVSDQGIGIPEDELLLIFDKFVQSSRSSKGAGGTGLGLSIASEITLAHGGTLRAENNHDGGASFILSLPQRSSSAPLRQDSHVGIKKEAFDD